MGSFFVLEMSSTGFCQGYQLEPVSLHWGQSLGLFVILGPPTDKWPWGPSHLSIVILKFRQGEEKGGGILGGHLFKVGIIEAFPIMP